ncbi:phytanoyl-CoA dioxygenase family protein, partial [Candidatus Poribacteria bacterium]|nr:phytanoyl-CoA dioxygenase family protein [Candidatus Poribacteria bacterium]
MLTNEQIEQFHTSGFLNLGRIYDDAECAEFRAEMFRVMRDETERKPVLNRNMGGNDELAVVQIVNMWQASDMYLRHAEHPKVAEAVAQLCDTETLRIWHDQV